MANRVVLTFAGEDKGASSTFDRVGGAARTMDSRVRESAGGFDRAGEAADSAEGKAQGFASTLTGTADTASGVGMIMSGNLYEGFVMSGQGLADLAEGFSYTLIPAMKGAVGWLGQTRVGTLAQSAASHVAAGASKVWAAGQWLLNASFMGFPLIWIIAAIAAVVAIIVVIATKTNWFQRLWGAAWGGIKTAAVNVWEWLKALPGRLVTAFSGLASIISKPFRAAFNLVSDAWNNTVGSLSFRVPSWIPGLGGKGWDVPDLPRFHFGGRVPGSPGAEVLGVLRAGETVSPGGGGARTVQVGSDGSALGDLLIGELRRAIGREGGNVQMVLGTSRG